MVLSMISPMGVIDATEVATKIDDNTIKVLSYATLKDKGGKEVEVVVNERTENVKGLQAKKARLLEQVAKIDELLKSVI